MANAKWLTLGAGGPVCVYGTGNAFSPINYAIAANNSACEYIFQAAEDATITHLGFRYGARTGTPPTYIISLQGVDASGNPDGTIKGGATPASATFTPPASTAWDGLWQWIALANAFNVTRGAWYAMVIGYSSGTVDGSNNGSFTLCASYQSGSQCAPYAIQNAATVRTRKTATALFGYKSASAVYGFIRLGEGSVQFSSNSDPNEYALAWALDAGFGDIYKVAGIRVCLRAWAAGKNVVMTLYDGTTPLQQITLDGDVLAVNSQTQYMAEFYFDESALSALTFGNTYRIGFAPGAASTNLAFYTCTVAAQADFGGYPGGTMFWLSTRNGGAWTDVPTERIRGELILADIMEPAGGGGMLMSRVRTGY